jgi:hypothetical protein
MSALSLFSVGLPLAAADLFGLAVLAWAVLLVVRALRVRRRA